MATSDFTAVPANASGPPLPDYGSQGESKDDREPPGGYLGKKKPKKHGNEKNPGSNCGGPGPVVVQPIEPNPSEPDYSADKWDYIHYAASRADQNPSEMSSRIRSGDIDAHTSETKYTPLHIAVKFGQAEAVRQLIAARARIDSRDVLGQTALSLSCCYDVGNDIPKQLLDAEANIEHVDRYSWTPLFWASSKGYYSLCKLLVARGANKNARDKRGQRPYDVTSKAQIRDILD